MSKLSIGSRFFSVGSSLLRHGGPCTSIHFRGFQTINFAQMSQEVEQRKSVLLDVREKAELLNDGQIPGGKNVPIGEVPDALTMDSTAFSRKYGFPKPNVDDDLVVLCKAGVRAQLAAKALEQLGYKNIRVYSGINDWKEKGGKLVRS